MRLYYIDKPGCHHMMYITKRVQKIYQLEAELEPYVIVDFWGNVNNEPASVTLYVGDNCVLDKEVIDLDKEEDFEALKDILWYYVRTVHNPYDLTDKDGCLRNMDLKQKNNVIQGWQAKRRNLLGSACYMSRYTGKKNVPEKKLNPSPYIRYITGTETMEDKVKHWSYRDPLIFPKPNIDLKRCKQLRYLDCNDNFPVNTQLWERCIDESRWLCDEWYKNKNNDIRKTDKLFDINKKQVCDYLKKNDTKVDKNMFDRVIDSGLFDNLGNRMGNKSMNIVEGFGKIENGWFSGGLLFFVIIIILVFIYFRQGYGK